MPQALRSPTHANAHWEDDKASDVIIMIFDFASEQREHFSTLLGRKWDCFAPGHGVCVPTVDGGHHQLSDEDLHVWIEALCRGEATTAQPPEGLLKSSSPDPDMRSMPIAIPMPSSQWRRSESTLAAAALLRRRIQSMTASSVSTGAYGPGYRSGKAIEWLGQKTLNAVEDIIVRKRIWECLRKLRRWRKAPSRMTRQRMERIYGWLDDALEMTRPCYSGRVRMYSFNIRYVIESYLVDLRQWYPASENIDLLHGVAMTCSKLYILQDVSLGDELLEILTRTPLSPHTAADTLSAVFKIITRELAYSPWDALDHLGEVAVEILKVLPPQTRVDIGHINTMKNRRQHHHNKSLLSCRPWEVALFVSLEARYPSFRSAALSPHGVPGLVSAIKSLLQHTPLSAPEWNALKNIIWTLQDVLQYDWVVHTETPGCVAVLFDLLERAVCRLQGEVSCYTLFSIHNIFKHCPEMMMQCRVDPEHAIWVVTDFLTLLSPSYDSPTERKAVDEAKDIILQLRIYSDAGEGMLARR